MNSALVWITIISINILFLFLISFLQRKYDILPVDRIATIAILLSADLALLMYVFVLDPTQCIGAHPGCLINQNQGVLTLGAILIGAITIYVDARLKQVEARHVEIRLKAEAFRKLQSAVDELIHNLFHYAIELDDNLAIVSFPSTTFEATFALMEGDTLSYFSPELSSRLHTLQRILNHNRALLQSSAELNPSLRAISLLDREGTLTLSISDILGQLRSQDKPVEMTATKTPEDPTVSTNLQINPSILELVSFDERIITHSVRFIMEVAVYQNKKYYAEFPKPLAKIFEMLKSEVAKTGYYDYDTKSSEADEDDAAGLRATDSRLYCWVKDKEVEGVDVVPLRTIIRDIRHEPH